jgi:hypothetical protein
MHRLVFFQLEIIFGIFIFSSNGQSCPYNINGGVLQYDAINASSIINTNLCNSNAYSSISIIYTGTVLLNITAPSIQPIVIAPVDGSSSNVLQISAINTNANRIQIQMSLSSNQVLRPLFLTSSSIIAPTSTLSINIMQTIPDAMDFEVVGYVSSSTVSLANYEIIFNTTNTNSGVRKYKMMKYFNILLQFSRVYHYLILFMASPILQVLLFQAIIILLLSIVPKCHHRSLLINYH